MNTRYRHFKGGIYTLICEAIQESDKQAVMVYRAQDGSCWTRPTAVFFGMVEVEGRKVPRFELIVE